VSIHLSTHLLPIIVSFSYICIPHSNVATQLSVVKYSIINLLLIVHRICQWKNFENPLTFGEDMDNKKAGHFWGYSVYHRKWKSHQQLFSVYTSSY